MSFKDHFSGHAQAYAAFRPTYPPSLFGALAGAAPGRQLAWDVATGSGQAAVMLAGHFERVVATDASKDQVQHAPPHPRVEYRVEPAETSSLADASVELVTIAQALHWFDLERFWAEVRRVTRRGALVASWTYNLMHVDSPGADAEVLRVYRDVVGDYWPAERRFVEDGYASLSFPFEPLALGDFQMTAEWNLDELVGYVGTWSAVARYRKERGEDPLVELRARLARTWGPPETKHHVAWPLALRVGRVG